MDPLARAHAHEHDWLRRQATTVTAVQVDGRPVGELVETTSVPLVRDHNAVVLGPAPDLTAGEVVALLDRELGDRGHAHRRLWCDADDADRWEAGLVDAGYERTDTVVLRWPGGTLDGGDVAVAAADGPGTTEAVRALLSVDHGHDADVLEQLVALATRQHGLGVHVLVARDDGGPVGAVRVFPGDGVAQVEELQVHPRGRRRGVGRALLAAALATAGDRELVFLTADPDDWPTGWYLRLGLQRLGRSAGFVRVPVDAPA